MEPTPAARVSREAPERLVVLPTLKDLDGEPVVVRVRRPSLAELYRFIGVMPGAGEQGGAPLDEAAIARLSSPEAIALACAACAEPRFSPSPGEAELAASLLSELDVLTILVACVELHGIRSDLAAPFRGLAGGRAGSDIAGPSSPPAPAEPVVPDGGA